MQHIGYSNLFARVFKEQHEGDNLEHSNQAIYSQILGKKIKRKKSSGKGKYSKGCFYLHIYKHHEVESDAWHFSSYLTPLQCSTLRQFRRAGIEQIIMAGHTWQPSLVVEHCAPRTWHIESQSLKMIWRLINLKGVQRI